MTDEMPFSFAADSGEPAGVAIELCRLAAGDLAKDRTGLRIDYVDLPLAGAFEALAARRADLPCGAITETLARRKRVDFSIRIFQTGAGVLAISLAIRPLFELISWKPATGEPS